MASQQKGCFWLTVCLCLCLSAACLCDQELWRRIRNGKYSEAYAAKIIRSILRVVRPLDPL
eukprot:1183307-Prorocentrum_minimum.AAC.2